MKIEKIQTFVVGNPPPRTGGRYFIFVKLTTDTGVTGIGEIYTATYSPQIVCKVAEDMFARYIFGTDPFHIEKCGVELMVRVSRTAQTSARLASSAV